jgi:uncharacterized protein YecE (DUF72 family)
VILVGTTGWSHESWVGPFYPVTMRATPDRWLEHYATRFRTVELTSSFDAMPDEALVAAWSRAAVELQSRGRGVEFSLQMPREATHEAIRTRDVERAWSAAARFERQVLEPLADEGLLGAVLVALPADVEPDAAAAHVLDEALRALADRSVALDAPTRAWREAVAPLLDDPDVALVQRADEAPRPTPGARHAYVRFGAPPEPAHLHPRAAIEAWADRARAEEAQERAVRVYFANAGRGEAATNAVEMMHVLGDAQDVPRPRLTAQTKLPV